MRKTFLLLPLLCSLSIFGQSNLEEDISKIQALIGKSEYKTALNLTKLLYNGTNGDNSKVNFLLGKILVELDQNTSKASEVLLKAFQKDSSEEHIYYLAKSHHLNNEFDLSLKYWELYKALEKPSRDLEQINDEIARTFNAKKLLRNPELFDVQPMENDINTEFSENYPIPVREGKKIYFFRNESEPKIYMSDFDGAKWSKGVQLSGIELHKGDQLLNVSNDEDQILISRMEGNEENIYMCYKRANIWQDFLLQSAEVNSTSIEKGASITPDGNTLYFSSDRPGGHGGFDIYKVQKLPAGEWGLPINLGPTINSSKDEINPFIYGNNETLYFASNSNRSIGGFDIFHSDFGRDLVWSSPRNIGYPINTVHDNKYFSISSNLRKGFIQQNQSPSDDRLDISSVFMVSGIDAQEVLSCKITNDLGKPIDADITLINEASHELNGVYRSNAVNGKFILLVVPEFKYHIIIESPGYRSKTIHLKFPFDLDYLNKVQEFKLEKE